MLTAQSEFQWYAVDCADIMSAVHSPALALSAQSFAASPRQEYLQKQWGNVLVTLLNSAALKPPSMRPTQTKQVTLQAAVWADVHAPLVGAVQTEGWSL